MVEYIENVLSVFKELISLFSSIYESIEKKIERKINKTDILKQIIFTQRQLKYLKKGQFSPAELISYENQISDFIKSFYGDDFEDAFSKNSTNIYWYLRNGNAPDDCAVEEAIEPFINYCRKKHYKV